MSRRLDFDKSEFMEWLREAQLIEYPTDPTHIASLDRNKVKKLASFRDCMRFLTFVVCKFGTYGVNIHPTQMTMAEEFGISSSQVSRYLAVAVDMGIFVMVRSPDRARGLTAEYRIGRFWESDPDPFASYAPTNAAAAPW